MGTRKQMPSQAGNWLYKDFDDNNKCFSKLVYLAINATPWPECTDDEKTEWERANRPQEPDCEAAHNQIEDVEVVQ